MRHATGIRADVRMEREGDTRSTADKDGVTGDAPAEEGERGNAARRTRDHTHMREPTCT